MERYERHWKHPRGYGEVRETLEASNGGLADWKNAFLDSFREKRSESILKKSQSVTPAAQGRDNKGLKYKGYEVERVFRVEHAGLWSAYALERRSIGQLMLQQGNRHPKTKVSTWRDWMKSSLLQDKTSNEVFLFHGTKHDMAEAILKSGLDERVCSLEGLFGAGVYLAENSSKSDEYCTPDSRGICRMLLVRACGARNAVRGPANHEESSTTTSHAGQQPAA
ncbi:hypothetical protein GUITHDRAFT_122390 [Guillardia theta CCMP2712]|uniref:Poly [ADP-ribose] polymerase n=1 Tax=Guillardia theta (strain CCMP2712) TaxID=905079 RepID=L1I5A9_GUITC|nr:hypothetical protein GUITHDRAFT_122390 [Guillardia theta CCMP2712]EKX31416.1 hypothetical protein GUITHDRAFT_122390 [Guillardia theta CCMP2712]|eukprot:XP_005818396.1 hypothetical protein GUITHDRAFT_122390 [Guillardia theta CCMP2712]